MTALPARYERVRALDFARSARPTTLALLPQVVHLDLYQGDDAFIVLALADADGSPSDLSDAVALSQIRANVDSDVMAEFTPTITDNEILLWLPHEQSTQLSPGHGVWDCQITEHGTKVTTLVAGNVTIEAEVSW